MNQNRSISYLLCALQKAKAGGDTHKLLHEVWLEWVTYLEELKGDEDELLNSLTPHLESHKLIASDVIHLVGKAQEQVIEELRKVRRDLKVVPFQSGLQVS